MMTNEQAGLVLAEWIQMNVPTQHLLSDRADLTSPPIGGFSGGRKTTHWGIGDETVLLTWGIDIPTTVKWNSMGRTMLEASVVLDLYQMVVAFGRQVEVMRVSILARVK